jgi:hypothetical protein
VASDTTAASLSDVTAVLVLAGRTVRLTFETGEVRDIDLGPLLWSPAFAGLDDDAAFAEVAVDPEAGTIVWPNGADIAADTLYRMSTPATTEQRN